MKIRTGDKVKVISGKDKGRVGEVLAVLLDKNKVLVADVNKVKRHVKPGTITKEGGIIEIEKPIDVSNVMYFDEKADMPVRLGYVVENGKKFRINKKTGEKLEK